MGQVILGLFVGSVLYFHPDVTMKEEGRTIITESFTVEKVEGKEIKSTMTTVPFFKNNEFNSKEIKVNIQTGNLLLFPSKLDHSVPKKTTSGTRISLSFNSFVKGNIGDNEKLTGLILK